MRAIRKAFDSFAGSSFDRLLATAGAIALAVAPTAACSSQAANETKPNDAAKAEPINESAAQGALTSTGPAGPFASVKVTATPTGDPASPRFSAVADAGEGKRFALGSPDEPAEFFIVEAREILFAPIDRSGRNAVIILYDSSQIGPGHGTDRLALVYRIEANGAVRVKEAETRLEGTETAADARRRLAEVAQ